MKILIWKHQWTEYSIRILSRFPKLDTKTWAKSENYIQHEKFRLCHTGQISPNHCQVLLMRPATHSDWRIVSMSCHSNSISQASISSATSFCINCKKTNVVIHDCIVFNGLQFDDNRLLYVAVSPQVTTAAPSWS